MSWSLTLPEASRSAPLVASSSWPAPSATAITACARFRMRCFSAASRPSSPSSRSGISGIKVKLTSWLAMVAPAAMKPA